MTSNEPCTHHLEDIDDRVRPIVYESCLDDKKQINLLLEDGRTVSLIHWKNHALTYTRIVGVVYFLSSFLQRNWQQQQQADPSCVEAKEGLI